MRDPYGNHQFFFAYEFPYAVNVPEGSYTIIIADMIEREDDLIELEDIAFPYFRAALIQRVIEAEQTDGFK